MKKTNLLIKTIFAASTTLTLIALLLFPALSYSSEEGIAIPHDELEWADIAPFVKMSSVTGNMHEGEHGTMGRMEPGMKTPVHKHTEAYHGVVISGTMTHQFVGQEEAPKLNAGSYWHVPAGKEHYTTCGDDAACIFYFHSDGKFDMTEVESKQ